MEKIVEDLDKLLSRMDIFLSEIKDIASDMVELMNILGVVPENILQIKDIFKRQCMTIAANASNYKIDSLQIRALVKKIPVKPISHLVLPDFNPNEIRYWYEFRAINSIYLTPPDFPEATLKRDFRTCRGESHFSPIMIALAKKSPLRSHNVPPTTKNEKDRKRKEIIGSTFCLKLVYGDGSGVSDWSQESLMIQSILVFFS
ncbi:hypothetical protein Tco_1234540 [Tanacetum coccineum]